jgi:hypothetical protein
MNQSQLKDGDEVKVYYNFRKKCFSIVLKATGKVCAYLNDFELHDVKTFVSEKGRQRVLKEKRKNVHAFLRGKFKNNKSNNYQEEKQITYNPYKTASFIYKNGEKFNISHKLKIINGKVYEER